jgi:hypothetical protein
MAKKKIKIKDLPEDFDMIGCKLKGKYIYSGWNKGFWMKKKMSDSEIFPLFFKSFNDIKDWEIEIIK